MNVESQAVCGLATRLLIASATCLALLGCAPTQDLSRADRAGLKDVGLTVSMRFQELSINCKGLGCAGILYGVGGDPSAPAVLTAAYRKVAPPAAKLIAEEAVAQLRSRGIEVRGVGETRFQTLPQSVDVLAEAAGAGGSTVLNLQVWDFGISRTGTTDYQPSVMIQARLIRRDGARLVYAKAYNFGPEASGLPVNLGGSDIRFPSVSAAQAQPERLLQGLRAGVREVLGRIANDLAQ